MKRPLVLLLVLLALVAPGVDHVRAQEPAPVVVSSKPFGESYLLAEMFAQLLERQGIVVRRLPGLGSTEILFSGLRTGSIDLYPEYTGTGLIAVLKDTLPDADLADPRRVFTHVAEASATRFGVRWLAPLGFENTYAIAVRADTARQYQLKTLTDLARVAPMLRAGFTPDFIQRPDGLPGLMRAYGEAIRPPTVRPLLQALKYQALADGAVDVVDGYTTDGLLARYQLVTLQDDRRFFPPYEAAALLSARAAARPEVVATLSLLSGRLSEPAMRALNQRVDVNGEDVRRVAADALTSVGLGAGARTSGAAGGAASVATGAALAGDSGGLRDTIDYVAARRATLLQLTLRHLWLVTLALLASVLVALPVGLALERVGRASGVVLGVLGVIQTIPSIALLAFMVPFFGVGVVPALIALWLYALLPIARGTFTGVRDADPAAVEAAEALGMTPRQRLLRVRLPLAAPTVMAGVRTAGVLTVGATTLAAFIGAGGLGEPIVTGLALADTRMILFGAIPAAVLALLVDGVLGLVERWVRPAHLRRPA